MKGLETACVHLSLDSGALAHLLVAENIVELFKLPRDLLRVA